MQNFTQGVIHYSSSFLSRLMNTGDSEKLSANESRYLKITNIASVITSILIIACIPVTLFHQNYTVSALLIADLLCLLTVIELNYLGHQKIASQTYLAAVNAFILLIAFSFGFQSGLHDFFYFTFLLPFLLFNLKDYRDIIAGGVMAITCYYIFQYAHPYFAAYNLSLTSQAIVYGGSVWIKFALLGAIIYTVANYSIKYQAQLTLANNELEEQAFALSRSRQDLEQFAYLISHDLKAPVRNISSFMKLLSNRYSEALPPDGREFVNMSLTGSERLAKQIDDMLSYYKIDRNLPPATEVDLNDAVKTISMELTSKLNEANATIIQDSGLPMLKGVHSNMIYHVFNHLIVNGIKFNANPEPEVKIDFAEAGDMIRFCIADNGIGIDKAHESKLFKMFKRLHTNDKFEGTGIGLAICKKIVTYYQGEIWFESEAGSGTSFYFTLPKHLVGPVMPKLTELTQQRQIIISKAA